ncbi:hypothetical protein OBBRIDRAFT_805932 [Obba rivulosa]|uniref:Zn(2)-C6 fungal-type domain-containing protein n=1 Tax=Obba rivulosa TaxID=1052685 RepID=A0A8E2DI02_9APHY|nr:hypothetical protein OBBRIDRAFT_805932 [Obba rivulosa]
MDEFTLSEEDYCIGLVLGLLPSDLQSQRRRDLGLSASEMDLGFRTTANSGLANSGDGYSQTSHPPGVPSGSGMHALTVQISRAPIENQDMMSWGHAYGTDTIRQQRNPEAPRQALGNVFQHFTGAEENRSIDAQGNGRTQLYPPTLTQASHTLVSPVAPRTAPRGQWQEAYGMSSLSGPSIRTQGRPAFHNTPSSRPSWLAPPPSQQTLGTYSPPSMQSVLRANVDGRVASHDRHMSRRVQAPTVGRNNPVQFSNTDAAGPIARPTSPVEMAIPERKDDAALTGQSAPSNWRRGKRQRREEVVDGSPPDLRPVKRSNGGDVQPGGVAGPSRAEQVPTPSRKRSAQTVVKRPREPKYGACDPCRLLKQRCTRGDKDKACDRCRQTQNEAECKFQPGGKPGRVSKEVKKERESHRRLQEDTEHEPRDRAHPA